MHRTFLYFFIQLSYKCYSIDINHILFEQDNNGTSDYPCSSILPTTCIEKVKDDNRILINKCSLFILIASPIDFQGRINLNDIFTIL